MSDEEFVKTHWPQAHLLDGRYSTSLVWVSKEHLFGDWVYAAEFTRDRLEEIRQVRREIEEVAFRERDAARGPWREWAESSAGAHPSHADYITRSAQHQVVWSRILARLESILADLTPGMKEQS